MKKLRGWWFLARFYTYTVLSLVPRLPYYKHLTKKGEIEKRSEKVFRVVHKWADYTVKIGKSDVKVYGTEKIPKDRTVLFISNHESYADVPMLIHALPDFNFGFMLVESITNIPFIGDYLKYMDCVAVSHRDVRQAAKALKSFEDKLSGGRSMMIFPEGKRSFNNTPAEFKNGAFRVVRKTGVTVVPIYIHNVHLVYEGNERYVQPADITVTVLDPIETKDMSREDVKRLNETCYNIIYDYSKNFED